jgi:hypothetical protein
MDGLINIPDSSFFITNQKYRKKQKEASPADACGVTLFYTRGLGMVVLRVLIPQPYG